MLSTELKPAPMLALLMLSSCRAMTRSLRLGDVGVLGGDVHFGEVLHLFEDLLADFDADHVIDFAGIDGEFAADDAVLGFLVAFDVNFLDVVGVAFLDVDGDVHGAAGGVGGAGGLDEGVAVLIGGEKAPGTVHVADGFQSASKAAGLKMAPGTLVRTMSLPPIFFPLMKSLVEKRVLPVMVRAPTLYWRPSETTMWMTIRFGAV